jgi:carboxypeptidase C (cathepsin A)
VNLTNMLWVEYPIGVGFSRGEPTATNEEEPAAEFIEFFRNFQVRPSDQDVQKDHFKSSS